MYMWPIKFYLIYSEGNQNVKESRWVQWALMCVMMVTGVHNERQRESRRNMLIVYCGMLSHSSSMTLWRCWILAGTACPYHKNQCHHGALYFTMLTSANCSPTRCKTSAICPVQLKPGFICEEHTSPVCQWPSKGSIFPLKSVTTLNCSHESTAKFSKTMLEAAYCK